MIRNHRNEKVTPRQRAKELTCEMLVCFALHWADSVERQTGAPVAEKLTAREEVEIDRQIRRLVEAFGRRNAWPMDFRTDAELLAAEDDDSQEPLPFDPEPEFEPAAEGHVSGRGHGHAWGLS